MRKARIFAWSIFSLTVPAVAWAQNGPTTPPDETGISSSAESTEKPMRRDPPIFAYTYAAYGSEAKTIGVHAYGVGVFTRQDGVLGGGGAVWGSPVDRLTLIVDGQRSLSREFSPSAAAIVRIAGNGRDGFSAGALGKFKVEGFAAGPDHDEIESEIEVGALLSYRASQWYIDANSIVGRGTGDEGESDAEGRLRFGRELGTSFRIGIDGQVRARLAGPRYLANGRTWDFAAGPQAVFNWRFFYASLTAGPTTIALATPAVGWSAMVSAGGVTF
jgi:hypothetical protein